MKTSKDERRAIVGKANKQISISRQCALLGISRSVYYYDPSKENDLNLRLMELIDKKYLKYPFMGVPTMTQWLRQDVGINVNKKRVERLYKLMDLQAIVPGPHTSKPNRNHKKYPYLIRNMKITHKNQVWGIDITYIPIKRGYMYLVAIIDIYSRYVVNWSLSNTMDATFCINALERALDLDTPMIFNTDQGAQFTSTSFTKILLDKGIKISMDGRGRALDNIFVERLWRTVKYENIYMNDYQTVLELHSGLERYFEFYNQERLHQSLDYQTPNETHFL